MPKGIIHSMISIGHQKLVTLHYYCPPIQRMRVYDLAHNAICTVKADCGAWIPSDRRQIVALDRITF